MDLCDYDDCNCTKLCHVFWQKETGMCGSEYRLLHKLQNILEMTSVSYTNLLFSQASVLCVIPTNFTMTISISFVYH